MILIVLLIFNIILINLFIKDDSYFMKNENLEIGDTVVMIREYKGKSGWIYPVGLIGTMRCYHCECESTGMADTVDFGKDGAISYGVMEIEKNRFNKFNYFSPDFYLRKIGEFK